MIFLGIQNQESIQSFCLDSSWTWRGVSTPSLSISNSFCVYARAYSPVDTTCWNTDAREASILPFKRATRPIYMILLVLLNGISAYQANSQLGPYTTSQSAAIQNINVSGHTAHVHSGYTRHLYSGRTRLLCSRHSRIITGCHLYKQSSPNLLRSVEQEKQTTNAAYNSLLKTLRGNWAGNEYYRNLRMAIHLHNEIRIFTASNWTQIVLQLP